MTSDKSLTVTHGCEQDVFMKTRKVTTYLAFGALLATALLLGSAPLFAQNQNAGQIRGTVTDQAGARVPGVQVTILNTQTGVATTIVVGNTGVYDAPSLEPGRYSVSFSKAGFKRYVRDNIELHVEALTIDGVLQIGTVNQTVVVSAEVPLLQTETSDNRTTLTATEVTELPSVGRGWYDYTGLLPGANPGASGGSTASGEGVGVNGQGSYEMNWLVDGGVAMLPVSQNPDLLQTPLDAIAEVSFITSNMSAEYGNGEASFNVITKSGTNQFHGSAFEFVQNDVFEARNFFNAAKAPLRWNEYGGTVGGPIKKDKLFFFFSYQRNPTNTFNPGLQTYPSRAMRSGDFSAADFPTIFDPASTHQLPDGSYTRDPFPGNQIPASRIDPVAAKIQSYYPTPNQPGLYNNFYYQASSPTTTTYYNGKLDYDLSSRNRLTGSIMYVAQGSANTTPTAPIGTEPDTIHEITGQISDVWTISPTTVNEFRASLIRESGAWIPADANKGYATALGLPNLPFDNFPNISISGTAAPSLLGESFYHATLGFNSFMESDAITLVRGRHILKFGGEFNKLQQNQAWGDRNPGSFSFSGLFTENPQNPSATGLGYADFLLGLPNSWSNSYTPEYGGRDWNFQAFAQDDFKISPRLTLNLGVRWEVQSGWTEVHNHLGSFDPNLTNPATNTPGAIWFAGQNGRTALQETKPAVFAPRVGFAWTPKPNWSVRGSYGIFDTLWGANNYAQGMGLGTTVSGSLIATDFLTPVLQLKNGPPALSAPSYPPSAAAYNGQGVTYFPYNTPVTYIQEWHISVQHEFANRIMVNAAYVGNHGSNIQFETDFNQVTPANITKYGAIGADMQSYRPYPQFQNLSWANFRGWSNYNSLQLSAKKALSHSLTVLGNYTYAKALDTGTMVGWGGAAIDNSLYGAGYQDSYAPGVNYGRAAVDIRNLFNGSMIYELPVGEGKALLNHGGLANALIGGWQLSSTWQLHSGMPFTPLWGGPNLDFSLAGDWRPNRVCNGQSSHPSVQAWFDTSCFVQAATGTFGNTGRNVLDGPGFAQWNGSLAKSWKLPFIREEAAIQFRVDAYNVLNRTNFGQPNINVTTGQTNAGIINSASQSRNLQIGARLSF
jgi:outer membrane receptor protein involved in Fe transport